MKKVLLGAVVILGVFALGWFMNSKPANAPVAEVVKQGFGAELTVVSGTVEYNKAGSNDWLRVAKSVSLAAGDAVEVLGDGRAVIMLDDGSAVRLSSNTSVTLNKLGSDGITITNEKGQVYTRVVKADRPFVVQASGVSYQSMGTAYKTINETDRQGVEVYESKVKVLGVGDKEVLVETGSKYYVVNTKDKKIEKTLTKIDPKEVQKDEFVQWNQKEDDKVEGAAAKAEENDEEVEKVEVENVKVAEAEKKVVVPVDDEATEVKKAVRSITVKQASTGKVSWTIDGYSEQGFKIVWSQNAGPTYPTRDGDQYIYLSDPAARSTALEPFDGTGTYYVRVCEYLGGKCGVYSNQIKVSLGSGEAAADESANTGVNSIALRSNGGGAVSWSVNGYSEQGFKVVWSKNPAPTYPTRDADNYIYLTDPKATTSKVDGFDGPGTYYIRVCEYLGGKCGVYSNQVTAELDY